MSDQINRSSLRSAVAEMQMAMFEMLDRVLCSTTHAAEVTALRGAVKLELRTLIGPIRRFYEKPWKIHHEVLWFISEMEATISRGLADLPLEAKAFDGWMVELRKQLSDAELGDPPPVLENGITMASLFPDENAGGAADLAVALASAELRCVVCNTSMSLGEATPWDFPEEPHTCSPCTRAAVDLGKLLRFATKWEEARAFREKEPRCDSSS